MRPFCARPWLRPGVFEECVSNIHMCIVSYTDLFFIVSEPFFSPMADSEDAAGANQGSTEIGDLEPVR